MNDLRKHFIREAEKLEDAAGYLREAASKLSPHLKPESLDIQDRRRRSQKRRRQRESFGAKVLLWELL